MNGYPAYLNHGRTQRDKYLLFDSHYYLADWQPMVTSVVYLVGGAFHSLPGKYILPLH